MKMSTRALGNMGWSKRPAGVAASSAARPELVDLVVASEAGMFWSSDEQGRLSELIAPGLAAQGIKPEDLVGKRLASVFEDTQDAGDITPQRSLTLKMSARAKINNHVVRVASPGSDTPDIWLQISGRPQFLGEDFAGYCGTAADVTALILSHRNKLLQEKFDQVTEFYNAAYFAQRYDTVFTSLSHAERSLALVVIDIERFRSAQERFGTNTLNLAISEMAGRLRSVLKHRGEVGRVSEDQLRIMLFDVDDRGDLSDLAERIIKLLSQTYRVEGRRIQLDVSIGVAVAPYDAISPDALIDAANLALRSVRQAGGGTYGFFSTELAEEAARNETIQLELENALARGEFTLRYDPIVSASSNEVATLRAELHWDSPELGEVPANVFWPMIEASEAAPIFGEWMLHSACADAARWPAQLRLALALPQGFLRDPDCKRLLSEAIAVSKLSAARLEVEISEEFIVANLEAAKKLVDELGHSGVRTVVSSFGDGSSSITMLADLKFDRVDISPAFIRNWALQPDRTNAILTAVVSIARSFGITTSVREIDAMDVLDAAIGCGVDLVHGSVFAGRLTQDQIIGPVSVISSQFSAKGPPRQRAERITLLRKIGLIHEDHYYDVLLKNISKTGAKVAGIAGVPKGTEVVLDLGSGQLAVATVVNSDEKSQGLQFEVPLVSDGHGGLMTRHRISPYMLAEAGLPVAALSSDHDALKAWKDAKKGSPAFVQLQLTHL